MTDFSALFTTTSPSNVSWCNLDQLCVHRKDCRLNWFLDLSLIKLIKMFIFNVVCSCWGTKISLSSHDSERNSLFLLLCCCKVFGDNTKGENLQRILLWWMFLEFQVQFKNERGILCVYHIRRISFSQRLECKLSEVYSSCLWQQTRYWENTVELWSFLDSYE